MWNGNARKSYRFMLFCSCVLSIQRRRRFLLRGRFLLQFGLIVVNRGPNQIFQRRRMDLVALEKIDRSPRIASKAGVEELVGIRKMRAVHKGNLHLILVGVGDRDHAVARPHRASHPFPFLDDLAVGAEEAVADAGERFAAPVVKFGDQLVNMFRWIHWILMP